MSFADLRRSVLEPDLCASCGLCEAVCPLGIIETRDLTPHLRSGISDMECGSCNLCLEVCPGLDPETPDSEAALFGRCRTPEDRWLGHFTSVYGARAANPAIVSASSSGGATTALLGTAFEAFRLDAILVAGRDRQRPWRAAPALCSRRSALAAYAQSTYQLSAYLTVLRDLLQGSSDIQRAGIVGLACHIQAVRKLQRHPSTIGQRAQECLPVLVELACSSNTTPSGTETFIQDVMGVPLSEVSDVRYRDNDYPGEFAVTTWAGERHAQPVWRAIRHFKDFKTHRCLSCGDWLSGLADISICDGDPNIFRSSQNPDAGVAKHGTVFVRTAVGETLVQAACSSGALEIWKAPVPSDEHLGLLRKRNRRAQYEQTGGPIPEGPIPGQRETIETVDDDSLVPAVGAA